MIEPKNENFRCGFVGLAGVPNVGKSTLLNALVGQKISIVTRAPQTTRHRICGILTEADAQIILVDVPGILATEDRFNLTLVETAQKALEGCDAIVHLRSAATADSPNEEQVVQMLRRLAGKPILQVWNKIDAPDGRPDARHLDAPIAYAETHFVSALKGDGLAEVKRALAARLPPGPPLYPEDDVSDRNLRFLCAEIVREKIFLNLRQEIPYGVATWTDEWEEGDGELLRMRVVIQTERRQHKQIIIGAGGKMLKKIGSEARREIELLVGRRVFLGLWVTVKPGWRKKPSELRRLELGPMG